MYDVFILSIEQLKQFKDKILFENLTVETVNHLGVVKEKYYYEKWPLLNNLNGILYHIYTGDPFGEFGCGDDLFEFQFESESLDTFIPYWSQKWEDIDDLKNDLVPISIKKEFSKSFKQLVDLLLKNSPIKTILFLCCGQSLEREIIYGKISKKMFYGLLEDGHIATNICYIIGE